MRRVSPLAAIRVSSGAQGQQRDPMRWLVGVCLAAGIIGFALTQGRDWRVGLGFAGGLAAVFALLAGTAKGLMFATKRFARPTLPFTVRQGLANLHRPNNRTLLLLLSLGLGTFLMVSLFLVQQTLLTQLVSSGSTGQPNAILFDIQEDQRDGVSNLVHSLNLPILDEAPIVTMRKTADPSQTGFNIQDIFNKLTGGKTSGFNMEQAMNKFTGGKFDKDGDGDLDLQDLKSMFSGGGGIADKVKSLFS